jgi:hypothetical protein
MILENLQNVKQQLYIEDFGKKVRYRNTYTSLLQALRVPGV